MTWKDVFKTLVCCGAALFLVLATMWIIETDTAIRSLQKDVERLKSAQRPLINIDSKYSTVFAKDDQVTIESAKEAVR